MRKSELTREKQRLLWEDGLMKKEVKIEIKPVEKQTALICHRHA